MFFFIFRKSSVEPSNIIREKNSFLAFKGKKQRLNFFFVVVLLDLIFQRVIQVLFLLNHDRISNQTPAAVNENQHKLTLLAS